MNNSKKTREELPDWIQDIIAVQGAVPPEQAIALTVSIATESVSQGGGPFGALMLNAQHEILTAGWNHVVQSSDSTAHAEVDCLRRSQRLLKTHNLRTKGAYFLYSSTAPCIQCFGALWWSGISGVSAGATKETAEATGFDEGPMLPHLWEEASKRKGITYTQLIVPGIDFNKPFETFKQVGGVLY